MRQGIPVNHPVWYTDCTVGTDAIRHTQLIAPALFGNPHNKYSFVICRSCGEFFPICRANSSQKPMAEINKQYITNINLNPEKHVCFQRLWIQCHTKTGINR
jgi:hypothetical protein